MKTDTFIAIAVLLGGAFLYFSGNDKSNLPDPVVAYDELDTANEQYRQALAEIFTTIRDQPKTGAVKKSIDESLIKARFETYSILTEYMFSEWFKGPQETDAMIKSLKNHELKVN
jgi:hypothetical protein